MEAFVTLQSALKKTFSSLTVFSDLNWDKVFNEYLASHEERPQDVEEFKFNFPFYLQSKASVGDCPVYLFELAYFELAQDQILEAIVEYPSDKGLSLNPTATFLNLEYDVGKMMGEAVKGVVRVIHRHHVLCLYRDPASGLNHVEVDQEILAILQALENGPLSREKLGNSSALDQLITMGLVIENK